MNILLRFVACCGAMATMALAKAQPQFLAERINTETGLASNGIKGLALDNKTGFLWMATEAGMYRYNGSVLHAFKTKNDAPLLSGRVGFMTRKSDGTIYGSFDNFQPFEVADHKVRSIKGIPFLNSVENILQYRQLDSVIEPKVATPFFFRQWEMYNVKGELLVKNLWKLYRYTHHQLELVSSINPTFRGIVLDNRLLFIDSAMQVFSFTDKALQPFKKIESPFSFTHLLIPKQGVSVFQNRPNEPVYLLTGKSCWKMEWQNGRLIKTLLCNQIPTEDNLYYLQVDTLHNYIYLGTENSGLVVLRPKYFNRVQADQLGQQSPHSMYPQAEFANGQVQVSSGALVGLKKTAAHPVFLKPAFLYFFVSPDSMLYYASDTIFRYDCRKQQLKPLAVNTWNDYCIFAQWKNTVYFTTNRSICHLSPKGEIVVDYRFQHLPITFRFYDMKLIEGTKLLIASSHGVYKYHLDHPQLEKVFTDTVALNFRTIFSFQDYYFLGTYGSGIYVYHNAQLRKILIDYSDYLNFAHCFMLGRHNDLWISTNNGIFSTTAAALQQAWKDSSFRPQYRYYGKQAGIDVTELNEGCVPCAIRMVNGQLSYPGIDGLLQFNADSISRKPAKLTVYFDQVLVNDSVYSIADFTHSSLPVATKQIRLALAIGGFFEEENINVSFALDNDSAWQKISMLAPEILLQNIGYGQHQLRLRWQNAINGESQQMELPFFIARPWFQKGWFYALCVVLLAVCFWACGKYRDWRSQCFSRMLKEEVAKKTLSLQQLNNKLHKSNEIKNRMIAVVNHDVLTPLKYMHIAAQSLIKQMEDVQEKSVIEQIATTAKSLELTTSSMLQWLKYTEQADLPKKQLFNLSELVQMQFEFIGDLKINTQVAFINMVDPQLAIAQLQEPLRVVMYNVLINALRATDKGSITVSCTEDGDIWVLRIADTGGGMSADKVYYLTYGMRTLAFEDDTESAFVKGNGVGYRIIRDLMGVMQASLAIESKLGEGSTVSLIFLK